MFEAIDMIVPETPPPRNTKKRKADESNDTPISSRKASRQRPDPSLVFCTIDNIPIRQQDLDTLKERQWLNDEVINAYIHLVTRASSEVKMHAFSTYLFNEPEERKRWFMKVFIFSQIQKI